MSPTKSNTKTDLEKYLKMTGETLQDVMQGAFSYGPQFIDELVEQALKEHKRIVWIANPNKDLDDGPPTYKLMDLKKFKKAAKKK